MNECNCGVCPLLCKCPFQDYKICGLNEYVAKTEQLEAEVERLKPLSEVGEAALLAHKKDGDIWNDYRFDKTQLYVKFERQEAIPLVDWYRAIKGGGEDDR